MNNTKKSWTGWNIFFAVLASLIIIIIGFWFVIFYDHYDKIAKVITGIWGAIAAVFPVVWIINKNIKEKGLVFFFGHNLIRILLGLYFIILLSTSFILILNKFKVHQVIIEIPSLNEGTDVTFTWDEERPIKITKTGYWVFKKKLAGIHTLIVKPEGYNAINKQIIIDVFSVKQKDTITGFNALNGFLHLSFSPKQMQLLITRDKKPVVEKEIYGGHELLEFGPDTFEVQLSAKGYNSDISQVIINSGDTTELRRNLSMPNKYGRLTIFSDPDEMDIFINEVQTNFTTPLTEQNSIQLMPGSYSIRLVKKEPGLTKGYRTTKTVIVSTSKTTSVEFNDIIPEELCEIVIKSNDEKAVYYLVDENTRSGPFTGRKPIRGIFPGNYQIIKEVNGQVVGRQDIEVNKVSGNWYRF